MSNHDKLTDEQLDEFERLPEFSQRVYAANAGPPSTLFTTATVGFPAITVMLDKHKLDALIAELRTLRKLRDEVGSHLRALHRRMPDDSLADASNKIDLGIILARHFGKEQGE